MCADMKAFRGKGPEAVLRAFEDVSGAAEGCPQSAESPVLRF